MLYLLLSIILAVLAYVALVAPLIMRGLSGGAGIKPPISLQEISENLGFYGVFIAIILACLVGIYILSGPIVVGLVISGPIILTIGGIY